MTPFWRSALAGTRDLRSAMTSAWAASVISCELKKREDHALILEVLLGGIKLFDFIAVHGC